MVLPRQASGRVVVDVHRNCMNQNEAVPHILSLGSSHSAQYKVDREDQRSEVGRHRLKRLERPIVSLDFGRHTTDRIESAPH